MRTVVRSLIQQFATSTKNPLYFACKVYQAPLHFQERFHTTFPLTQVLNTYPSLLNTVKSASAPGLSVPFWFSIPKHLGDSFQHTSKGIGTKKKAPCRVESGALDRLAQRASGELDKVPDASVQSDDAPGEGGGSFEVQLGTFLDESFTFSPLVNSVLQVRIQDLHGYLRG